MCFFRAGVIAKGPDAGKRPLSPAVSSRPGAVGEGVSSNRPALVPEVGDQGRSFVLYSDALAVAGSRWQRLLELERVPEVGPEVLFLRRGFLGGRQKAQPSSGWPRLPRPETPMRRRPGWLSWSASRSWYLPRPKPPMRWRPGWPSRSAPRSWYLPRSSPCSQWRCW